MDITSIKPHLLKYVIPDNILLINPSKIEFYFTDYNGSEIILESKEYTKIQVRAVSRIRDLSYEY